MAEGYYLKAFDMTHEQVKYVLDEMVYERLSPITEFSINGSKEWSQQIGNDVKEKLKEMGTDPNYKY